MSSGILVHFIFCTFVLFFVPIFTVSCVQATPRATYTAAVYEHHVYNSKFTVLNRENAVKMMNANLDVYEKAVKEAKKQNVDIIAFPEDGLYGFSFLRDDFLPFTEDIPDPKTVSWTPCLDFNINDTPIQHRLSCLARNYSMYLVANMGDVKHCSKVTDPQCPGDGRYQYNTDVVFDSHGTLVARYHKRHLYKKEMHMYNQPEVEYATFDTPFAGKFGVFTCFDVLFKDPAVTLVETYRVRNVVFPTAWMNSMPFLSAVQFHQSWAMGMGVNFLAANTHELNYRMTGSGIYTPQGAANYTYNAETQDGKLVTATIRSTPEPTNKEKPKLEKPVVDTVDFVATVSKNPFNFVRLKEPSGDVSVCHKDLCCYLRYTKDDSNELYAFGAFDGLKNYSYSNYLQICTLLKCADATPASCGHYSITTANTIFKYLNMKGSFGTPYIFPSVLTTDIGLAVGQWAYQNQGLVSSDGIKEPLLSATLFGRWYDRDHGDERMDGTVNGCTRNNVGILARALFIAQLCTLMMLFA